MHLQSCFGSMFTSILEMVKKHILDLKQYLCQIFPELGIISRWWHSWWCYDLWQLFVMSALSLIVHTLKWLLTDLSYKNASKQLIIITVVSAPSVVTHSQNTLMLNPFVKTALNTSYLLTGSHSSCGMLFLSEDKIFVMFYRWVLRNWLPVSKLWLLKQGV